MHKKDELLRSVMEILFTEWDLIGVNSNALRRNEYDSYARTICRYLTSGADAYKISAHLGKLRRVSMGLSTKAEEVDRRVAEHLIRLTPSRR